MDARVKPGHDEKGKRPALLPNSRGRGLTVASRRENRTTVL